MKHKILAYLVVFSATLLFIPTASATWSGFRSLGKTPVVGEPSCAQLGTEEVMCVAQSQQHTLMANQFSKGAWSGWTNLSGTVTSDPSCVNDGTDTIVCGVTSATNRLVATVFDGTTWGSFVDSGQQSFSDTYEAAASPSCALLKAGKVFCAIRSTAGALVASVFNGAAWGKFSIAATSVTSAPGCASDSSGNMICNFNAIVNSSNNYVVNRFDGAKWNGLLVLGPDRASSNNGVCIPLGGGSFKGQVDCIAREYLNTGAACSQFHGGIWQNSNWSDCGDGISGAVFARTGCGLLSSGSITCTWINNQDSLLYENTFNGSAWTGYVKVGGPPIVGGPACTTFADGKIMCVVVGINNQALSVTGP